MFNEATLTSVSTVLWRPTTRRLRYCALACVGALLGMAWAGNAVAQQFSVRDAKTTLVDGVYRLEASLDYQFTPPVLEALNNGVTLTLALDIEVNRQRRYLWDEGMATLEQRYELQYHALTEQYLLHNLNSGSRFLYSSLGAALATLGSVQSVPLIDAQLLDPDERYMVRVQSRLDLDKLPVPLRLNAYVSTDWWLSSGWYSWNLAGE